MKADAIYARQSVEKKDSLSIESQIRQSRRFLRLPDEAPRIYKESRSGKNISGRPELLRLLDDIRAGLVGRVIVYKLDRISRNLLDFCNIWNVFEQYSVEFLSCNEHFDTSSEMGKAMLKIAMIFAEMERSAIVERVRDNYFERAGQGFYLGGTAPFGYRKVDIRWQGKKTAAYEPNPTPLGQKEQKTAAEWAAFVFETYARTDLSLGKIAQLLTQRHGLLTTRGAAWTSSTLGRLLRNPAYVRADGEVYHYLKAKGAVLNQPIDQFQGVNGCYLYHRQADKSPVPSPAPLNDSYVTLAPHTGLISASLWLACQHKLDRNKQVKCSRRGKNSWLSGLMRCGVCGTGITVVNNNRGKNYINCYGRKQHLCSGRSHPWRVEEIEAAVLPVILRELHRLSETARTAAVPVSDCEESAGSNRLSVLRLEYDDKLHRLDDFPRESRGYRLLLQQLDALQRQIDSLDRELLDRMTPNAIPDASDPSARIRQIADNWSQLGLDCQKRIARILIAHVIVEADDGLKLEVVLQDNQMP